MNRRLTRKEFFREAAHRALGLAGELCSLVPSADAAPDRSQEHLFAGDLTDELLQHEAARLGLDPADRAAVLAALSEQLSPPD